MVILFFCLSLGTRKFSEQRVHLESYSYNLQFNGTFAFSWWKCFPLKTRNSKYTDPSVMQRKSANSPSESLEVMIKESTSVSTHMFLDSCMLPTVNETFNHHWYRVDSTSLRMVVYSYWVSSLNVGFTWARPMHRSVKLAAAVYGEW